MRLPKSVGHVLAIALVMAAAGIRPASGQDSDRIGVRVVPVVLSEGHTLSEGLGQGAAPRSASTPQRVLAGLVPASVSLASSPSGRLFVTADPAYDATTLVGKESIASFLAVPARLPSSGGRMTLEAAVYGVAECRFSSARKVKGLPALKSCASGWASVTVILPANPSPVSRSYEFELTARSATGTSLSKSVKVVEQLSKAPRITVEPKSQRGAGGTWVTFKAAASGSPTPIGAWQVSSNVGASWSNIPQDDVIQRGNTVELEAAVDALVRGTGFVIGDAGSLAGYEYRAVFTNVAGSARTSPAMLTALTGETASFAGYTDFAPSGGFTSASADWVVPTINCSAGGTTWAAQWPGVGRNGDVVQDGTIEGCNETTVLPDAAWYEMLGDAAVNGGGQVELPIAQYPVSPGDHIAASVRLSDSIWTLAITDSTQGWMFSISKPDTTPPLDESVAQVFTESSIGEVANFGTTDFTGATATLNGRSGPLGDFFPVEQAMYAGSTPLDVPGQFDPTGENFTDTWEGY